MFLDKELEQVVRDAELGRRLVDKLVRVATRAGPWQWVLVHVEVQGARDQRFAQRIFTYNSRLYDRYGQPVASLALLADHGAKWKPSEFGYRVLGCEVRIRFPVVKLNDYASRIDELLADRNPFALVTAAHLLTQASKRDPGARGAAKWRLAKLLYQRNWNKQRILDLYSVIDWMMRLPEQMERALWDQIQEWERSQSMPYVTSAERFGVERGRQEGRQEGRLEMLTLLLSKRFGPLPDDIKQRLAAASAAQLARWGDNVLDAPTLESVFHTK